MPIPEYTNHAIAGGTPDAAGELGYESSTGRLYYYDGFSLKVRRVKNISDYEPPVSQSASRTLSTTTATYCTPGWLIPANTLSVGDGMRIRSVVTTAAATAANLTVAVKLGTTQTTSDATINGTFTMAGTALASGMAVVTVELIVRSIGSAGTLYVVTHTENNGTTGSDNTPVRVLQATPTVNTTVANYLGLAFTSSVANVDVVQMVDYQIV